MPSRPQPVIDHDREILPIADVQGSITPPHSGRRQQTPGRPWSDLGFVSCLGISVL